MKQKTIRVAHVDAVKVDPAVNFEGIIVTFRYSTGHGPKDKGETPPLAIPTDLVHTLAKGMVDAAMQAGSGTTQKKN